MRCFIALKIPDSVKKEIKKIQDSLPEFFGKKTETENLHLTLKFLGEISEERVDEVKKKLKEIRFKSFDAELGKAGVFSEKFVRIIWMHLIGCENLQKVIDEKMSELGFSLEKRFMSHLTIARVKKIKNKQEFLKELKDIKVKKWVKWKVNEFLLMKSELSPSGPKYSVIQEYGLN